MNINSKRALIAGVSGTSLQWYDFALFGYFSPIIAQTWFPSNNNFASLLNTFVVFMVGYLLAPLGSFIFGFIGDRFGRKKALTLSILTMAIPTALISIIPSYQNIGILAPLFITILRMLQGLVASSEFIGSAIFLVEHAQPHQKALFGCLSSFGYSFGLVLAGLISSFLTLEFMPQGAWRFGFALALIGGLIIFYLRTKVNETPEYVTISPTEKPKYPSLFAFKERPYAIIGILGLTWCVGIFTFGTYIFMGSFLNQFFNLTISSATFIITVALMIDAIAEPFFALLADKYGLTNIMKKGLITALILIFPIFYLLSFQNTLLIALALFSLSLLIAFFCAPLNAYLVSLFPKECRYSGLSLSFNLGISILGSPTPLVLLTLIHSTNNLLSPALYYFWGAIVGLASISLCEFSRKKAIFTEIMI